MLPSAHKKILWVHNFERGADKGGVWMFNQHELLGDEVDLYFAGRLRNPLNILRHYVKLRKLAVRYELVHAQYGSMVGLLCALLPGKRLISLKGSDWYRTKTRRWQDLPRIFLGYWSTRFSLYFLVKDVVVMSNNMKKQVLRFNPKLNVNVLVDPIDLKRFYKLEVANKEKINVLFASVSLTNPVKRYHLAKAGFDIFYAKDKRANWYVMSNVKHTEVNQFINQADVIVLTSTHEGWPNVIKECLAVDVPFVSTDVSDLKSIAEQTKSCFVIEREDPNLIAEAIEKAIAYGKTESLRGFVEPFDMSLFRRNLFQVYKSL